MKTIKVAIISVVALALSGCATGYYQRGYASYGSAYSSPSYYQSYGHGYSSPGTSITYGRYYVQPSYRPPHYHDEHRDWRVPTPHFDRHDGWQNHGAGRGEFRQDHHADQAPRHQQPMLEWREHGFGRRDGDGNHREHGGWGGRHGRHGE